MFKKIEFDFNLGIYYSLLAVFYNVFRDSINKAFVELPSIEIVFFSSLFGVVLLLISLNRSSSNYICKKEHRNKARTILAFRGFMGFLSAATFFYCINHTTFVNSVVFIQSSTLFGSLFMFIFFKEKLSLVQSMAVFVGFIGVIFVISPNGLDIDKISWVGLLCAITTALAYMSVRELRKYYGSRTIALGFLIVNLIGSSICMLIAYIVDIPSMDFLFEKFVMPDSAMIYLFLFLIALFNTLSHVYKNKAYARSKVGVVGVISYLRVPLTLFIGVFFLDDFWPDFEVFIGIIFVTLSCVMVSYMSEDDKVDRVFRKHNLGD